MTIVQDQKPNTPEPAVHYYSRWVDKDNSDYELISVSYYAALKRATELELTLRGSNEVQPTLDALDKCVNKLDPAVQEQTADVGTVFGFVEAVGNIADYNQDNDTEKLVMAESLFNQISDSI